MNSKGADQTAWLRRLICAFVLCIMAKTGFLMTWLNCSWIFVRPNHSLNDFFFLHISEACFLHISEAFFLNISEVFFLHISEAQSIVHFRLISINVYPTCLAFVSLHVLEGFNFVNSKRENLTRNFNGLHKLMIINSTTTFFVLNVKFCKFYAISHTFSRTLDTLLFSPKSGVFSRRSIQADRQTGQPFSRTVAVLARGPTSTPSDLLALINWSSWDK